MKITAITAQLRDQNRVNISIDGKYAFSLDIAQVGELGVKVGVDIDEAQRSKLEEASQFGKLYARTLEYALSRPHSQREMCDYLRRKTLDKKYKPRGQSELKTKPGVSQAVADAVLKRLLERGYVDDVKFARFWVENRSLTRGASRRKLTVELIKKGISQDIINEALGDSGRDDAEELRKMISKKASKYDDEQKLMTYLARQGFSYDDIKAALKNEH
ncbi:MAG: RecX family transcriptional regulator [Candidatus Nomurabacteria bacterium]|jgi:regulatory protein|nr:RecX family transcriptional regulator [Candidatus Nomurabacteria bacterium]